MRHWGLTVAFPTVEPVSRDATEELMTLGWSPLVEHEPALPNWLTSWRNR